MNKLAARPARVSRPDPVVELPRKPVSRPAIADLPTFTAVAVKKDSILFSLDDGRTVTIPLAWSAKLSQAKPAQRRRFSLSAHNVFWDDVDEIIGVENVLYGRKLYL